MLGNIGNIENIVNIVDMDYLVDNVVGSIPELEEIEDSGKKVVELLGVKES